MNELFNNFLQNVLPRIISSAIIVILGLWLSKYVVKLVGRILNKGKAEYTVITFLCSILRVFLIFVVVISAVAQFGVDVTSIITALGAALVTAGLAMQSSLSNIASGVVIILNKPFKAGDIIEFENLKGTVQSIKLFYTTLLSVDNKVITIPNSRLTTYDVVNLTTAVHRRLDLSYTISYDDDITQVKGILYSYIATMDNIIREPEPAVYVGQHKASGVEIIVQIWINEADYWDIYYQMQEKVKELFDENNIKIPYNTVEVKQPQNNSDNKSE